MLRQTMRAGLIGLGSAGVSTLRYLLRRGLRVKVTDQRRAEALRQNNPELANLLASAQVEAQLGGHDASFLDGLDILIPGPGVPLDLPLIQAAKDQKIPIVGELALAAGKFSAPVIAITGSNGKTTVTSLIGHLLAASGKRPFVGGNIGTPLLEYFVDPSRYDMVVLELSSFQLDLGGAFRPDCGILLNITPDHLDRHGSMERYAAAKLRLFAAQRPGDTAILGVDDALVSAACLPAGVRRLSFGTNKDCDASIAPGGAIHLQLPKSPPQRYTLAATRLHSSVNRLNAACALLAASLYVADPEKLQQGLASFVPAPHRMAEAGEVHGVRFIDDSKATNIGALAAALNGCDAPVILIAGGRDKGAGYGALQQVVAQKVKHLVLIGEAADLMEAALSSCAPSERAADMAQAVNLAKRAASSGDVVLLAPGCASFDMFSGYAERGRIFSDCVRALMAADAQPSTNARQG